MHTAEKKTFNISIGWVPNPNIFAQIFTFAILKILELLVFIVNYDGMHIWTNNAFYQLYNRYAEPCTNNLYDNKLWIGVNLFEYNKNSLR